MGKEENSWRFPVARAPEEQALEASTGMGASRKNSDSNVDYLLGMLHRKYGTKALGTVRSAQVGEGGGGPSNKSLRSANSVTCRRQLSRNPSPSYQKNRTSLAPFPAQIYLDLSLPLWSAATRREA